MRDFGATGVAVVKPFAGTVAGITTPLITDVNEFRAVGSGLRVGDGVLSHGTHPLRFL